MTSRHLRAATLRRNPTDAEQSMWMPLRDRRLAHLKFRRQTPIGPYIVDLFCAAKGLIIELDGGQHNGSIADEGRTAWLKSRGYKLLRFWNNDVLSTILQHLQKSPSPLEGEGRGEGSTGLSAKSTS